MSMATEIWCAAAAQLHMFPVFHNNQGLAGGRYLILMDVIWFIIRASLTLSPSRLLPATALRCKMSAAPSQVSVLGAATPPHSLHCCRGRGEIFRTMLLFQPDIWMTAGPGPCWNVVHCIVTEGGNYQGVKTGYFGHILSSSSTTALRCRCRWSKLPNLPIFVGKRCERKYAGWAGAGCRAAASSEFIENVKWNVTHQAPALHFAQLFCKQSQ